MGTVFQGLTALAAIVAAAAAWWAIKEQNKRAKVSLSVNLTEALEREFNSMEPVRQAAARYLLRATNINGEPIQAELGYYGSDELAQVLDFFDRIGTMVGTGALDKHFIWNAFFPVAQRYWLGAEPIVQLWRMQLDRTLYLTDAESLSKTLTNHEKQQLTRIKSRSSAHPTMQEVRRSLQGEASLQ